MDWVSLNIFGFAYEIVIFLVLVLIGTFVFKKVISSSETLSNFGEVLPEDEIHTLRQVFYLIMMALAFINILYSLISSEGLIYFAIFDIAFSLFLAITLDKSSWKGKILLLLLVPFDSLNFILYNHLLFSLIDVNHVAVFIYFIKVYYDKFRQYTESHGLSVTIVILFALIFISFIITQIVEGVNPLDSLVMVSNAFTSNGYAVLGTSMPGKLNAIVLVWGGYILSGVGTATLTAAILIKHFNHRFEEMEELIRNNAGSGQNDDENS